MRSYQFTHTISRLPGTSVSNGLRAVDGDDPDLSAFLTEHAAYLETLEQAGCITHVLPADEGFPDSVFIEDAALCLGSTAIVLRPGAHSRFGEAAALRPALEAIFENVLDLTGDGFVDGGDILVTETEILVGLSDRTDQQGFDALAGIVETLGYIARTVSTPKGVLHFKSDCGLLDENTIFSTKALATSGCFETYDVILAPDGEEAAANLIRVNDIVLISSGFPKSRTLLESLGYNIVELPTIEAAKVDGGLSCMSLRFAP